MKPGSPHHFKLLRWLIILLAAILTIRLVVWFRPPAPRRTVTPAATPGANRPSLILISLDTLRPDHLGCYGYTKYPSPTPNLDRFAANALRFSNARSQAPWTLLSHMSLMTSELPSHNGVDSYISVLPRETPTLAELLIGNGYYTAALVNNTQLGEQWGFNRGFKLWREFQGDRPAGACDAITDHALHWLATRPPGPFFLFLHYYDAHSPYFRPPADVQDLPQALHSAQENMQVLTAHRFPSAGPLDPMELDKVKNDYDSCITWLDGAVGKLLVAAPPDAVVVIFSDHGEGFGEHGWFTHGGTLYDEEMRTVLLVRLPSEGQPRVIDDPVMLMDIAPTLLHLAGATPPPNFEGQDLLPLIQGEPLTDRVIPSETKMPIERSVLQSVVQGPWKAITSLLDGSRQLYRLPDESRDLSDQPPEAGAALFAKLEAWSGERDYWVLYARGSSQYEIELDPVDGKITAAIPSDISQEGSRADIPEVGASSHMIWRPLPGTQTKMLYVQLSDPAAALRINVMADGVAAPQALSLGAWRKSPAALPVEADLSDQTLKPLIDQPARMDRDGVLAIRYRGGNAPSRSENVKELDEKTRERLKSLGYLR